MFYKSAAGNIDWNAKLKALQNMQQQQAQQSANINQIGQNFDSIFNKSMANIKKFQQPLQQPIQQPGFFGKLFNFFKGGELQQQFINDVNNRASIKLAYLAGSL